LRYLLSIPLVMACTPGDSSESCPEAPTPVAIDEPLPWGTDVQTLLTIEFGDLWVEYTYFDRTGWGFPEEPGSHPMVIEALESQLDHGADCQPFVSAQVRYSIHLQALGATIGSTLRVVTDAAGTPSSILAEGPPTLTYESFERIDEYIVENEYQADDLSIRRADGAAYPSEQFDIQMEGRTILNVQSQVVRAE
jgi:hypothetical protein